MPSPLTRVTWSRNANGKIRIHRTLANLGLTNAQRSALAAMSHNQAMNTIRNLATRINWVRRANGTINFSATAANLGLTLTNAQRMVIQNMLTQNRAMNVIRQMARQR